MNRLRTLRTWLLRFAGLFAKQRRDRELDAEIESNLQSHIDDNLRAGMTPAEARRQALLKFGGVESAKESYRDRRGIPFLESSWQDIRFALRMLRKSPGFTTVAVLTLALGIGANTAIFSVTDQVLLRTLPVPNPQELVRLRSPGPAHGRYRTSFDSHAGVFSYPMYKDLRDHSSVFAGLLAWYDLDLNVSGRGTTQMAHGELVSGNYFETLEVTSALGRVFSLNDETAPGANPVAVLSYGYWSRQFGGDPSILNKSLTVNGVSLTVVGIARKGFDGVQVGSTPDIFIPVTMKAQMMPADVLDVDARSDHWLPLIGRLRPGITRQKAQAALQPLYAALVQQDAQLMKLSGRKLAQFLASPLQLTDGSQGLPALQHDTKAPLLVLMGMVGLVLLIACANLASLLIARGEARQREIAVRLAMGAGRWRLTRQLLTESLLIAGAGGAAGLALGSWCLKALIAAIPPEVGMTGLATGLDLRILWFALALTLLTSVLFGLAPAIRATRINLQTKLKDQALNVSEGRSNVGLRKMLIAGQVALTAVLLIGAGLLAHTLINLERVNLGLNADHILQFSVEPGLNGNSPIQTISLADQARQQITALPGVRSASVSSLQLFGDDDSSFDIVPEGYVVHPDDDTRVMHDYIGPNYFSTMGIPLISGREFTDADTASSPKVVIINQTLARRFFAGRNPIGLHLSHGGDKPDIQIVGVVGDSKWDGADSSIGPFLYEPYTQDSRLAQFFFYVRTESDPLSMAPALRGVISQVDPNLPVNDMRTLTQQVTDSMFNYRLVALLSISIALLAALLAALGLYGVLAYVVARRSREIGIRIALGGQASDILRLVIGQGLALTAIGGAVGIVAALVAGRWLSTLLYGVTSSDPLTFIGVIVLLALVSGAACYIPARRATRVDPVSALRCE
ncbi:MAG: ADOP family duplicated permease [Candidatus Acidiferrales bacterium]